jgi:NHLM bacteriocin system ABC transporter ATP-binding protein
MDELSKFDFTQGQKVEIPGNVHFSLQEKGEIRFLERGTVNLFAIQMKNAQPEGPRTLITQFSSPSLLFDMSLDIPEKTHEMVAITETPSVIWKIPLNKIESLLTSGSPLLHHWINQLALFFKEMRTETDKSVLAPETISLENGQTLSLKRATIHSEKKRIHWIQIQEGEVKFLGYPSLILNPHQAPFPLTYNAWVKSERQSIVQAAETIEDWQKSLTLFHHILHAYFLQRHQKEEEEAANRLQTRKEKEKESMNRSLQEMVAVINPVVPIEADRGTDPFFRACQIIGSFMDISFQMPEKILKNSSDDPSFLISALSQSSGVRYRQVRLTANFWKKDCGPLLALYGVENKPVALIDKKPGRYVMIDPETNLSIDVDKKVAKELSPISFCFYHSFPDELKSGKEIIHFYLKHNIKEFKPLLIYSLLAAIISLFPPFATEILFNKVIPEADLSLFWQVTLALFLAALSSFLFLFFRSLCIVRIEGRSSNQIQLALWDRLLKLPVSFFRRYNTGNLISRVLSTEEIRSLLSGNTARVMFSGIFSLFYIIAMFFYAPSLTCIGTGIIILSLVATSICARILVGIQKNILEVQGKINGFLVQIISAVGKLRTTGTEKNAFSEWASLFAKNKKLELNAQHVQNLITVCNYILPFLSFACIFGFIILHGARFSIGAFLAFNTAFISFYIAITDLSNTLMEMAPIFPLWARSKIIVEEPLETLLKKTHPGHLTGEISVDNVSFKYESNGQMILNNICLKVNPKEFIGILGPSGCGKSTLVRLLLGFEKPDSGAIYYDDKDLTSLAIREVRRQLGVVLQDEGIISGSIYDNLICGGNYSLEQIDHALKVSGFVEDVENFPMGLHTYLSMGDTTLSGGQKQRLLIARALLPNPKILIFDEATSALDSKSQETVTESLEQLDVTRIVIAHRLSTIRHADRIYVMDKGKIVQTGTFEEISSQPGLFSEMLKRQRL